MSVLDKSLPDEAVVSYTRVLSLSCSTKNHVEAEQLWL